MHHGLRGDGRPGGCDYQNRLMFSFQEASLNWVIGPFGSLVHVPETVFVKLFGKPFLLSRKCVA